MLSSDFTLQATEKWRLFFHEVTRSERWFQRYQGRWTGEWVTSGLGSKNRKEIIPRSQGTPPPESLLGTQGQEALWNVPFCLHISYTYHSHDTKINHPSMCSPQQKRKHSIHLYIPRDQAKSAMYTSAEWLNEKKTRFCCFGGCKAPSNLKPKVRQMAVEHLVEMSVARQRGIQSREQV